MWRQVELYSIWNETGLGFYFFCKESKTKPKDLSKQILWIETRGFFFKLKEIETRIKSSLEKWKSFNISIDGQWKPQNLKPSTLSIRPKPQAFVVYL